MRLTTNDWDDLAPAWSPNCRWIYFASNRTGEYQIWRMPDSGGESRQLTQAGGLTPTPSPDGQFVYFSTGQETAAFWRMPPEGRSPVRLLEAYVRRPGVQVERDGVFHMVRGEGASPEAAGYKLRFLDTRSGRIAEVAGVSGEVGWGFSIAPDRRSVIFVRMTSGASDLKIVRGFRWSP